MTQKKHSIDVAELKRITQDQPDFLRPLIQAVVQEVLETEMDEALQAGKHERTAERLGYRSGYYGRNLITRVGKLELRVPQDRQGHFSTAVFERYQRSEKALVAALAEMYVQGSARAKSKPSPRSCAAMSLEPTASVRSTRNSTANCSAGRSGNWTRSIRI